MANTFNANSTNHIHAIAQIHGAVVDFIKFLEVIQGNIGAEYSQVLNVPSRVSNLLAQKVKFDALNISTATIKTVLEKNHGYSDWSSTHVSDFNAVFTKAAAFMAIVESNIASIPASYSSSHALQYISATQTVQDALDSQINGILISVA